MANLPAPELLDYVRRAYREALVNPWFASLEGIERILREQQQGRGERGRLITDAAAEMEGWASFRNAGKASPKPAQAGHAAGEAPSPPKVHKKPWRNAPCPCRSGRKYKHCCGKVQGTGSSSRA